MQDNRDKETSTDEVQSTREKKKIPPGDVCVVRCIVKTKAESRTIKTEETSMEREKKRRNSGRKSMTTT